MKHYIFDINKITEFVFGGREDNSNEVVITENFMFDGANNKWNPNTKEIRESKGNEHTGQSNIRYDMVKMFIEILDEADADEIMTIGQQVTFDTMTAYGLIKSINDNVNE